MEIKKLLSIGGMLFLMSQPVLADDQQSSGLDLGLSDVTAQWNYGYENIISAFPGAYAPISVEENYDIEKIFHFYTAEFRRDSVEFKRDINLRRIEVFYTGGDWMEYGFVYFITDAGQVIVKDGKTEEYYNDEPRAYFIAKLSTPDAENGEVKPEVDFRDANQIRQFILNDFLTPIGTVNPAYLPLEPVQTDE